MAFCNKKVLLVGLGILGGGVGTANYLLKEGALLTVTDLKSKNDLKHSIGKIKSKKVTYRLGSHNEQDFREADIIVFNQSVPFRSAWVKFAQELKKTIESDLTIFSSEVKKNRGTYIGITGTRGKTTTSHWVKHFLPEATLGGNMPEKGLSYLATLKKKSYVLELSSFQLEYTNKETLAPKVAIITNLYIDHVNYHGTLKKYFEAKFKIFQNQSKNDSLILNKDNKNTRLALKAKIKAKIYFFSLSPLAKKESGIFIKDPSTGSGQVQVIFQEHGKQKLICELKKDFSSHQKSNLLSAMLGSYLYGKKWSEICAKIGNLPEVPMRQEMIFKNKNVTVINDGAATSPDAALAGIDRFKKDKNLILVCGGTDKQLDFGGLASSIKKHIKMENLFLLEGSATNKLIQAMKYKNVRTFQTLKDIVQVLPNSGTILFSPSAASFEKFKNEFDRGAQFSDLIKKKFGANISLR